MSVTEHQRHQLFNWFEEHMGPERAATMMNLVPPVGWGDVATKRDLEQLELRLDVRFQSKLDAQRADLLRTVATLLVASQAAVIGAVGLMLALLQ